MSRVGKLTMLRRSLFIGPKEDKAFIMRMLMVRTLSRIGQREVETFCDLPVNTIARYEAGLDFPSDAIAEQLLSFWGDKRLFRLWEERAKGMKKWARSK